jgi:hypothetical protein
MRRTTVLLSLLLLLTLSAGADQLCCPPAGALNFTSSLTGMQFGGTAGSTTGFGRSFITLNPEQNQITVRAHAAGIGPQITGARLVERNGSQLFVMLTDDDNLFDSSGTLERTVTVTQAQMDQLLANPSAFDFVITTAGFPGGALRGSLLSLYSLGGTLSGTTLVGDPGAVDAGGGLTLFITPDDDGNSILTYSFTPSGIGNSITALELRQGASGEEGTIVTHLAQNATLLDGRLRGSIEISPLIARQLMTNPGDFHVIARTSEFPSGAARAQLSPIRHELYFPVVGSVAGVGGSQWETDLRIFNASHTVVATVTLEFFPAGRDNLTNGTMNPANVAVVVIPPRGVETLDSAMNVLFGLSTTAGALRITSDQPIAATGRVFNDLRGEGRGTVGLTIDALTLCHATSRGVITGLASARAAGTDIPLRTNLGFFNPTPHNVTAHFEVRGPLGTRIGLRTITLAPFSQLQMPLFGAAGLFPDATADLPSGTVTFEASAPIFVYASVIDNVSSDSNQVLPVPDVGLLP